MGLRRTPNMSHTEISRLEEDLLHDIFGEAEVVFPAAQVSIVHKGSRTGDYKELQITWPHSDLFVFVSGEVFETPGAPSRTDVYWSFAVNLGKSTLESDLDIPSYQDMFATVDNALTELANTNIDVAMILASAEADAYEYAKGGLGTQKEDWEDGTDDWEQVPFYDLFEDDPGTVVWNGYTQEEVEEILDAMTEGYPC